MFHFVFFSHNTNNPLILFILLILLILPTPVRNKPTPITALESRLSKILNPLLIAFPLQPRYTDSEDYVLNR